MLECIALHGISDAVGNGFDDGLLAKFASEPSLPLKRLVLLDCDFPLHASAVVEAFRVSGAKEFECDGYVPQWEGDEWEQLEEGVFDMLGRIGSGRGRMVGLWVRY